MDRLEALARMMPIDSADACEMRSRFVRLCWPARSDRQAPARAESLRRSFPRDPQIGATAVHRCGCATGFCAICN